jgi:hypothetical protein
MYSEHNSSTRSHAPEEENRTRNVSKSVNVPLYYYD